MATIIMMKNPRTGIVKKGFYGFSWTTLLFTGLPALFRGDIVIGLVTTVLGILTCGLTTFIWAFFYNKYYTLKLVEKGYAFADSEGATALARAKLGIITPQDTPGNSATLPVS